jgi:hypothetical protein
MLRSTVLILAAALAAIAEEPQPARTQLRHGVSVVVPAGWRTTALDEMTSASKLVTPADAEAARRLEEARPPEPLIVLGKYGRGHKGLNPSIHINRQTLPPAAASWSPAKLMKVTLPLIQRSYPNIKTEEEITEVTVAGRPAARGSAVYEVPMKNGEVLMIRAQTVMIIENGAMYVIGSAGTLSGPDDVRAEFEEFLKHLAIEKPAS